MADLVTEPLSHVELLLVEVGVLARTVPIAEWTFAAEHLAEREGAAVLEELVTLAVDPPGPGGARMGIVALAIAARDRARRMVPASAEAGARGGVVVDPGVIAELDRLFADPDVNF
ncbi:MAG: hypothetical protein M3Q48_14680 [Actinomycetota bacterium]|nr:hypothetical protein [Actinomycetota bacterium]